MGVQFEGINDLVYFTHPLYAPQVLTRLADADWTFTVVDFGANAAFLEDNSTDTFALGFSAITGTGVTVTATGGAPFTADHVGSVWKAGHERESGNVILPLAFPEWQPATAYEVGDGVTESGTLYRCLEAHTSSDPDTSGDTFATDLAAAKWTETEDISETIRVQGEWTLVTTGFWRADILVQSSEDGTTGWKTVGKYTRKEDGNLNVAGDQTTDGFLRIKVENWSANKTTSGKDANTAKEFSRVMIEVGSSTVYGIFRVTGYTSPTVVTATILQNLYATTATEIWAEGAWSEYQGYPRAVCFHEERIVYAGTSRQPQRLWASRTGQYEDFTEGSDASDSFSRELGGRTQQRIEWMISQKNLLIGTKGAEFIVTSGSENLGLTPENANLRLQTNNGSKHVRCVPANDVILYVTRDGRKVREMVSVIDPDGGVGYQSPDLALLAEHIAGAVDGGITSISYQQQPDSVVWATTAEGTLISMTYDRSQDVIGWARHPTQGFVESVAVVTGEFRDEVWLTTKRTIDGDTKRFIERIRPTFWKDDTSDTLGIEDAFYVDCGVTYDGVATTTVSAPHLANMSVQVLADGRPQTDLNNTIVLDDNGEHELNEEASVIHVGLGYDSVWKPMRLDVDQQSGDTMGQVKIVYELIARFVDTVGCSYGDGDPDKHGGGFEYMSFQDTSDIMDAAIPPFTGDKELPWNGSFDTDTPIIIKQTQPLPMTLIGAVVKSRVTGNK